MVSRRAYLCLCLSFIYDLTFIAAAKLAYMQNLDDVKTAQVLPHSNPTRGDHKLRLGDVSCNTLCALNSFYANSSMLAVSLLHMVYGHRGYSYHSILSYTTQQINNLHSGNEERCECELPHQDLTPIIVEKKVIYTFSSNISNVSTAVPAPSNASQVLASRGDTKRRVVRDTGELWLALLLALVAALSGALRCTNYSIRHDC